MTKILEQASRVLAILGIALIVWAGMGAQTAKAVVIAPVNPIPPVNCSMIAVTVDGEAGWWSCAGWANCPLFTICKSTPKPSGNWFTCCY